MQFSVLQSYKPLRIGGVKYLVIQLVLPISLSQYLLQVLAAIPTCEKRQKVVLVNKRSKNEGGFTNHAANGRIACKCCDIEIRQLRALLLL